MTTSEPGGSTVRQNFCEKISGHWCMHYRAHPGYILSRLLSYEPNAAIAIRSNRLIRGKVDLYQVTCLYMLARQYNQPGKIIVDFGTMFGWSASMLASGAPKATVHTLEPDKERRVVAKHNLRKFRNVEVHADTSEAFQKEVIRRGVLVDAVFVDGDHHHCERDVGWWSLLRLGGVAVFHDYTAKYRSVVGSVDKLVKVLGKKQPDIVLVNSKNGQGMVGVYKDG